MQKIKSFENSETFLTIFEKNEKFVQGFKKEEKNFNLSFEIISMERINSNVTIKYKQQFTP